MKEREKSYRQEFRLLLPHETMWLQEYVTIEPIGPQEWTLVGVIVDITRLKETEAAMRTSEERNRLVLRASNDGFWDYDATANTMATSERCRSMLGLRPDATPQTAEAWRLRIHPDDLEVESAAWNKYQAYGRTLRISSEVSPRGWLVALVDGAGNHGDGRIRRICSG